MNVVNILPTTRRLPFAMTPEPPHTSVLLEEVVDAVMAGRHDTVVDVTLGAGGHSHALLEAGAGRVLGVDRDASALALAKARLAPFGDRFAAVHASFADFADVLNGAGHECVSAVVADLGVSSMQLDTAARGMSFRRSGPIDMRMDPSKGESALELIRRLDAEELANVLYDLGEERRSRRIARCIKQALDAGNLETTTDLRRAVVRAVGPSRVGGIDPATKTFQALRMAVNDELNQVQQLITAAAQRLEPGGRLAIITFHSLEDRLVKNAFRDNDMLAPVGKKPLLPTSDELDDNPRARSAKLRVAEAVA